MEEEIVPFGVALMANAPERGGGTEHATESAQPGGAVQLDDVK